MRISDWSSDVCSSDLLPAANPATVTTPATPQRVESPAQPAAPADSISVVAAADVETPEAQGTHGNGAVAGSAMQQVMARQLELMAKQLSVLRALGTPGSRVADAVTEVASDGASVDRQSLSSADTVMELVRGESTTLRSEEHTSEIQST